MVAESQGVPSRRSQLGYCFFHANGEPGKLILAGGARATDLRFSKGCGQRRIRATGNNRRELWVREQMTIQVQFLVDPQIGHVVANARTTHLSIDAAGIGLKFVDGVVQFLAVGREVGQHQAGGGYDRRAAGWIERGVQMAMHGLARIQQIAGIQVNVVDQVGDITLRQDGRRGWRRRRLFARNIRSPRFDPDQ